MEEVILSVDIILRAVVAGTTEIIDELIAQARKGEVQLTILDFALYCALCSVNENETINLRRLAELLKYCYIRQDTPEYLGPQDRESWTPSQEEIDNWRKVALGEGQV